MRYSIYEALQKVEKEAGIYIFYDRTDKDKALYVGQTQNIYERLRAHLVNNQSSISDVLHAVGSVEVKYMPRSTAEERKEEETRLIHQLRPVFNQGIKGNNDSPYFSWKEYYSYYTKREFDKERSKAIKWAICRMREHEEMGLMKEFELSEREKALGITKDDIGWKPSSQKERLLKSMAAAEKRIDELLGD